MILRILAVALIGAVIFSISVHLGLCFIGGLITHFVMNEFDKKSHWS